MMGIPNILPSPRNVSGGYAHRTAKRTATIHRILLEDFFMEIESYFTTKISCESAFSTSRAGAQNCHRPFARSESGLRRRRAGVRVESLGHTLRAGVLQQIRRVLIYQQQDRRDRSLRPRLLLGLDAGDGASRPRNRL